MVVATTDSANLLSAEGAEVWPLGRCAWIDVDTGKPWPNPGASALFILRAKRRSCHGKKLQQITDVGDPGTADDHLIGSTGEHHIAKVGPALDHRTGFPGSGCSGAPVLV
jgi:hypothetical protein